VLIEALKPMLLHLPDSDLLLQPGTQVELPEEQASRLLAKCPGKIRPILPSQTETVIEPAATNARPVYWERADMSIVGPGTPEFLARVANGPRPSYWVVAIYEGKPVWINSTQLRSKRQFEQRVTPRVVELIREPR